MAWYSSIANNKSEDDLVFQFAGDKPVTIVYLKDFINELCQLQRAGDDVVELHGLGSILVGKSYGSKVVLTTEKQI